MLGNPLTEDRITEFTIDLSQQYFCIESSSKDVINVEWLNLKVTGDLAVAIDAPFEFFLLKTAIHSLNDVSEIFLERPLTFSRFNPKVNISAINQIKSCLELLNFTHFFKFHNRLELNVSNIFDESRLAYGEWTERSPLTKEEKLPEGLKPSYFEFIITIPSKFDFLFFYETQEVKRIYENSTLIYFTSKEYFLDLSLLKHFQAVDPVYKSPFHITVKSFEIQPNLYINAPQLGGFNDSLGLISLGTFLIPTDNTTSTTNEHRVSGNDEKYSVSIPTRHLNQSLEFKLLDANLAPLEITVPSYIIIKFNILSS